MDNEAQFPPNLNVTRSLSAILYTRVTNLGSASADQQESLLRNLQNDFQVMRQLCVASQGQVIKSLGESLLMIFSSGSKAVECALNIQASLGKAAKDPSKTQDYLSLQHSMGIHLGEVLISESDVLGNQVNIAMQLQAEVPAGEICISHALYEIVKPNIQLSVKPLGEHRLKGVANTISLYQVLSPKSRQSAPSDPSREEDFDLAQLNPVPGLEDDATAAPIHLQKIAQVLAAHPAADRAKRLLWFACRNSWESNPLALKPISFTTVLIEIQARVPTFEALQILLQKAVSRLNKKAEYLVSLELILQQVKPLYDAAHPSLSVLYLQISRQLERQPSVERIKKLLIWAVRERWERDAMVLHQTQIEMLLPELTIRAVNPMQLQIVLHRATQSLNKPEEYQAVADIICQALLPLYEELQGLDTAGFTAPSTPPTPSALSRELSSELSSEHSREHSRELRTNPAIGSPPLPVSSAGEIHWEPLAQSPIAPETPTLQAEEIRTDSTQDQLCRTLLPSQLTAEQSLNLRFNLMQRVNPLRLKALMYSVLHETVSFSNRSWLVLQQQFLDALLVQLMEAYPNLGELRRALQQAAANQSPAEEFAQIAETLIEVLGTELKLHQKLPIQR